MTGRRHGCGSSTRCSWRAACRPPWTCGEATRAAALRQYTTVCARATVVLPHRCRADRGTVRLALEPDPPHRAHWLAGSLANDGRRRGDGAGQSSSHRLITAPHVYAMHTREPSTAESTRRSVIEFQSHGNSNPQEFRPHTSSAASRRSSSSWRRRRYSAYSLEPPRYTHRQLSGSE